MELRFLVPTEQSRVPKHFSASRLLFRVTSLPGNAPALLPRWHHFDWPDCLWTRCRQEVKLFTILRWNSSRMGSKDHALNCLGLCGLALQFRANVFWKKRCYIKVHAILKKDLLSTYSSIIWSYLTIHFQTVSLIVKELIYKIASKTHFYLPWS